MIKNIKEKEIIAGAKKREKGYVYNKIHQLKIS